jgi:hypothetical protein
MGHVVPELPSRHITIRSPLHVHETPTRAQRIPTPTRKKTSTTVGNVEKGESTQSPAPQDYHGLLQLLSNYVRLLVTLVGSRSVHTREVIAVRRKLRAKIDLYVGIGPWPPRDHLLNMGNISRCPGVLLPTNRPYGTTARVPAPVHHKFPWTREDFDRHHGSPAVGVSGRSSGSTADSTRTGTRSGNNEQEMSKPANWVVQKNADIADDIGALTFPPLDKFPKAMMNHIMSHGSLGYDNVRIGNKRSLFKLQHDQSVQQQVLHLPALKGQPHRRTSKGRGLKIGAHHPGFHGRRRAST